MERRTDTRCILTVKTEPFIAKNSNDYLAVAFDVMFFVSAFSKPLLQNVTVYHRMKNVPFFCDLACRSAEKHKKQFYFALLCNHQSRSPQSLCHPLSFIWSDLCSLKLSFVCDREWQQANSAILTPKQSHTYNTSHLGAPLLTRRFGSLILTTTHSYMTDNRARVGFLFVRRSSK